MQERFDRENIAIVAAQALAWGASLVALDRLHHPALRVAVVLFFCALMQGVFSMMHECFHGHAHGKRRLNDVLGTINATLFGTSYTLFAVNHHGHHVRNRTRAERVDYIYPDESAAKKIVSYYVAILGGIWLLGLVISLLAVFLPHRALGLLAQRRRDNTYAAAFDDFTSAAWLRLRLEALGGALFWLAVQRWFPVRHETLLIAYAAFAFSWSSLQWVYHVRTPLHPVEGAYNLRLPRPVRWLFLNFNYHLTHHRRPNLRWQELYRTSDARETQPLWYRWLGIFRCPQPLPGPPESIVKSYF